MLVAVPNNISITSFNNNSADTANPPRKITSSSTSPANTVRTATRLRFDFVGKSVLIFREWQNTTLLLNVRPPTALHIPSLTPRTVSHFPFSSCQQQHRSHHIHPLPRPTHQYCT